MAQESQLFGGHFHPKAQGRFNCPAPVFAVFCAFPSSCSFRRPFEKHFYYRGASIIARLAALRRSAFVLLGVARCCPVDRWFLLSDAEAA